VREKINDAKLTTDHPFNKDRRRIVPHSIFGSTINYEKVINFFTWDKESGRAHHMQVRCDWWCR